MSFDKQVSETCKACYFHIRALRHIRAYLTTEAYKTIAAAIVGSRLFLQLSFFFIVYLFIKSQVTYHTRLQSKYRLYEIRPTGPARRLATR